MKQLVLLVIFVAVGTTLSGCVSPRLSQSVVSTEEAKEIAEEITRISEPWGTTVLTKDTAYLTSLWADDFSYIGADGTVRDEKANLALYEDDTNTYTSAANTAFNVRVYGKNFAVADGDNYVAGKDKDGKPFRTTWRWTTVWIRKDGKWKVVAGHASELK
jgi:ketosteroid isomerase-like protein